MAKDKSNGIQVEGHVKEILRGGLYKVELSNGHTVIAKVSGRMYQANIRIIQDDRVAIEVNSYDLDRGRIVYRYAD